MVTLLVVSTSPFCWRLQDSSVQLQHLGEVVFSLARPIAENNIRFEALAKSPGWFVDMKCDINLVEVDIYF